MIDAISAAQIGMLQDQLRLQSISQNISGMQIPGYKREFVDNLSFNEHINPQMAEVSQSMQLSRQNAQGSFVQSQKATDLALSGDGYFAVQTDDGIFYTRRGDFHVNEHGELSTFTGARLLGKNGVLQVNDSQFTIDKNGRLFIDGHQVDKINVVKFTDPKELKYLSSGLYESLSSPIETENNTHVLQGFLEQANVKSMDEMLDMITTSRHFEASQRVMRVADNLLSTAINQLGESNV